MSDKQSAQHTVHDRSASSRPSAAGQGLSKRSERPNHDQLREVSKGCADLVGSPGSSDAVFKFWTQPRAVRDDPVLKSRVTKYERKTESTDNFFTDRDRLCTSAGFDPDAPRELEMESSMAVLSKDDAEARGNKAKILMYLSRPL